MGTPSNPRVGLMGALFLYGEIRPRKWLRTAYCEEQSKKSGFIQPPHAYEEGTNTYSKTTALCSSAMMGSSTNRPILQHCHHKVNSVWESLEKKSLQLMQQVHFFPSCFHSHSPHLPQETHERVFEAKWPNSWREALAHRTKTMTRSLNTGCIPGFMSFLQQQKGPFSSKKGWWWTINGHEGVENRVP